MEVWHSFLTQFMYVSQLNKKDRWKDHKFYLVLKEDTDDTDQFLHWRQRKLAALTTLLFAQNLGRVLRRCSAYLEHTRITSYLPYKDLLWFGIKIISMSWDILKI